MSFLADVHTYWASNTTLNTALPATRVYTGLIPEPQTFPYAVIVSIALTPTPTTGSGYYASFNFQISVFDTDPDNVEALANTIAGQFDYKSVSAANISVERQNGPVFILDSDTPLRVYHCLLEYSYLKNLSLPNT